MARANGPPRDFTHGGSRPAVAQGEPVDLLRRLFGAVPSDDFPEPEDPERAPCPRCSAALEPEILAGRTLHRCPDCRGVWLTRSSFQELARLAEQKAAATREALEAEGEADIAYTFAPSRSPRACPTCGQAMENFQFESTGIWLDACPLSHGLWLDAGELKLIAQHRGYAKEAVGSPAEGAVIDSVAEILLESL